MTVKFRDELAASPELAQAPGDSSLCWGGSSVSEKAETPASRWEVLAPEKPPSSLNPGNRLVCEQLRAAQSIPTYSAASVSYGQHLASLWGIAAYLLPEYHALFRFHLFLPNVLFLPRDPIRDTHDTQPPRRLRPLWAVTAPQAPRSPRP